MPLYTTCDRLNDCHSLEADSKTHPAGLMCNPCMYPNTFLWHCTLGEIYQFLQTSLLYLYWVWHVLPIWETHWNLRPLHATTSLVMTPRLDCHTLILVALPFDTKRKPPCIGGMELVSLRCNHDFTSASSYGLGWCKIAIATKWYQFHTTDKCGFLFMPWITDQYRFVRYTKLVIEIGTAVAKVFTFSIMTT